MDVESRGVSHGASLVTVDRVTGEVLADVLRSWGRELRLVEPRPGCRPTTDVVILDFAGSASAVVEHLPELVGASTRRFVGLTHPGQELAVPPGLDVEAWVSTHAGVASLLAAIDGACRSGVGTRIDGNLTPREYAVLTQLRAGGGTEQIATRLSIRPHTVRTHLQNLFAKLGVCSRDEAVLWAERAGVPPAALDSRSATGRAARGSR